MKGLLVMINIALVASNRVDAKLKPQMKIFVCEEPH